MKIKETPTPVKKRYEITCIYCGCVFEIVDDDLYGVEVEESIIRCPVCVERHESIEKLKLG